MKYYAKCIANGAFISLTTTANSEEEAAINISNMYKVDQVVEVSLSPFDRKQLFTKHKTYRTASNQ